MKATTNSSKEDTPGAVVGEMADPEKGQQDQEGGRPDKARFFVLGWAVLSVVAITYSIDVLPVVGPSVIADIGVSASVLDLGGTLLLAAAGATVMLMGQLADRYGHKTTFLWPGAGLLIIGGLLAGFADGSIMLIVGRILIGVGCVGLAVPALGFANIYFPAGDALRGMAFGLIAAAFGLGFVLAPIAGGALNEIGTYGWRLANLVVALFGVICFVGAGLTVKSRSGSGKGGGIDYVGSVLLMGGLGLLIFALNEASTYGWVTDQGSLVIAGWAWSLPVSLPFLLFMASAVFWACFVVFEIRRNRTDKRCVLDPSLFAERSFAIGLVPCSLFFLGSFAAILIIPQFFLIGLGYESLPLGLALLPIGVGIMAFGYLAGPIGNAITARLTVVLGFALIVIGSLTCLFVFNTDSSGWLTLGPLFVFGAGFGLVYARVTALVLTAVPPAKAGLGGATMLAVRLLAGAVGAALLSILLINTATDQANSDLNNSADLTVEQRQELDNLVDRGARLRQEGGGLSRATAKGSTSIDEVVNDPEYGQAINDVSESYAYGSNVVMVVVAIISLIGLLSTFLIPKPKPAT